MLNGRYTPTIDDVRAITPSVLKHRVVLNFRAEAEGIKPEEIIQEILDGIHHQNPDRAQA